MSIASIASGCTASIDTGVDVAATQAPARRRHEANQPAQRTERSDDRPERHPLVAALMEALKGLMPASAPAATAPAPAAAA